MGRVDDSVEFWVNELQFDKGLPSDKARLYLSMYGAWDDQELEEMDDHELAMKVLWEFCSDIKEEAYMFLRDDPEAKDWPEVEDWEEDDWERFQKEYCYVGLNH